MSEEAEAELAACMAAGACPALEAHIAEQLAYCESIERWNGDAVNEPRSCWPRTWSEFMAWAFSLECPR